MFAASLADCSADWTPISQISTFGRGCNGLKRTSKRSEGVIGWPFAVCDLNFVVCVFCVDSVWGLFLGIGFFDDEFRLEIVG